MTDGDDDPQRDEDAPLDDESSLGDLVGSIKERRGGSAGSTADDTSLDDLVESIKQRRDEDAATEPEGTGFNWLDDRDAAASDPDPEPETRKADDALQDLAASLGEARAGDPERSEEAAATTGASGGATRGVDAIEDDSSVLFLGSLAGEAVDRHCVDLLTPTAPVVDNVLLVTLTQSADDRLAAWREHAGTLPGNMKVVTVGDAMRSAGEATELSMEGTATTITITNVPDPSDLARLGITLTRTLSGWEGSHTRVCVHSLTGLLQYVDPQHLFRFLHVLRGKCDSLEAAAHYHMDPEAHENQTVRLFTSLFDTVVRIEDDGSLSVASGE